jgi:murein DD-endopeptidase MepM/ murein hydrolase activator NlpD
MKLWAVVITPLLLLSCVGPHYYHIKKNGEKGVYHRIEPGQTIWRISRAYGVEIDTIAKVNQLDESLDIKADSYLFIPDAERTINIPPYSLPDPGAGSSQHTLPDASAEIRFYWPLQGKVSSSFGQRNGRPHEGIDITAPLGTDIKAAADGVVARSGWGPGDYGKTVVITHKDGFETLYGHNSHNLVSEGARVTAGQVIGRVGRTGNATGNHVHFEIRKNGVPVNPLFFLP